MSVPSDPHPDITLCTCHSTSVIFCVVNISEELSLHYSCPRTIWIVTVKSLLEKVLQRGRLPLFLHYLHHPSWCLAHTCWRSVTPLSPQASTLYSNLFSEYTLWKDWGRLMRKYLMQETEDNIHLLCMPCRVMMRATVYLCGLPFPRKHNFSLIVITKT